MKKVMMMILVLAVISVPMMAARIQSTIVPHGLLQVYQVCEATSSCLSFTGYDQTAGTAVITAAPGVLSIVPGGDKWQNFVGAFHSTTDNPFPTNGNVTIKNVTLTKTCVDFTQCHGIFPTTPVVQQGTVNIRKWWPLMYETPSCEFELTILYGTDVLWSDAPGINPPAWVHAEQWKWHVDTNLLKVIQLLDLFRELPFGKDEVPLISDESLYPILVQLLLDAQQAYDVPDYPTAAEKILEFELAVMDACIGESPITPNPTGIYTGIAQTNENPACCKLLVDMEYILQVQNIGQTKK